MCVCVHVKYITSGRKHFKNLNYNRFGGQHGLTNNLHPELRFCLGKHIDTFQSIAKKIIKKYYFFLRLLSVPALTRVDAITVNKYVVGRWDRKRSRGIWTL